MTSEDIVDVLIQALEHDIPTAGVMRVPGTDRIIVFHKDFAPEVITVVVERAEVRPT